MADGQAFGVRFQRLHRQGQHLQVRKAARLHGPFESEHFLNGRLARLEDLRCGELIQFRVFRLARRQIQVKNALAPGKKTVLAPIRQAVFPPVGESAEILEDLVIFGGGHEDE